MQFACNSSVKGAIEINFYIIIVFSKSGISSFLTEGGLMLQNDPVNFKPEGEPLYQIMTLSIYVPVCLSVRLAE